LDRIYITKEEILGIEKVYREIMSYASIGILLKTGEVIGQSISERIPREEYFDTLKDVLKARGWVDEIEFEEDKVIVKGSIEVHNSKFPTCHILRGIIRKIYENYYKTIVDVHEEKCESVGDENCVFKIRMMG
jgi:predicted hydrocarbon binding protein